MFTRTFLMALASAITCSTCLAVDTDFAGCTVQIDGDSQIYKMQHDLARRHLDFHNSAYVVGIGSTDTELLISIIRKNGGVRTNNYLIPNAEGKVTLSQSVGTDYQKKEIVVECVGLK